MMEPKKIYFTSSNPETEALYRLLCKTKGIEHEIGEEIKAEWPRKYGKSKLTKGGRDVC